ncbi:hydrogenase formation protein HypD [Bacillaceae bacterium S4-13-56]
MQETQKTYSEIALSKVLLQEVKHKASLFEQKYQHKPAFMEVCGSHTMALAKTGIKQALVNDVDLISGPGCPVCVTDQSSIEAMITLSEMKDVIICTFGDMMRVPGSKRTLMEAKTFGSDVRVLYSPVDAIQIAIDNPDKKVIFLGIGFETTIPILALIVKIAEEKGVDNFFLWLSTKMVEPILRKLLDDQDVHLDGFLLPGHVSIVTGVDDYNYLVNEYNMSGVISGFEPLEILGGLIKLLDSLLEERYEIINDHPKVVRKEGNTVTRSIMNHYLEKCDEAWRGMGVIPQSGMDLKTEFDKYNAKKQFMVSIPSPRKTKCRCGEVIRGLISPQQCALFGKACVPTNPIGPCMVSSEGSCAAAFQYLRED